MQDDVDDDELLNDGTENDEDEDDVDWDDAMEKSRFQESLVESNDEDEDDRIIPPLDPLITYPNRKMMVARRMAERRRRAQQNRPAQGSGSPVAPAAIPTPSQASSEHHRVLSQTAAANFAHIDPQAEHLPPQEDSDA